MIIQECTVKRMARAQRLWKERESRFREKIYREEYTNLKRKLGDAGIAIQENPKYLVFVTLGKVEK